MTINAGIIGVGMIGQDHARRLAGRLSGSRVTAVTDSDVARARDVARSLPGASIHSSGPDLITASDVDAVVVTSGGATHEEFVLAAIEAGKPVFCEKPLAPTPEACLRIIEAEAASGRRLVQVGFMRRYDRDYLALKQALDTGAIGAPLLVHCAHRNPSVPPTFTSDMSITDVAVHEMDIVRWLLTDEVKAVSVALPPRSHAAGHPHDPQLLLLETTAGVLIDVEVFVNCHYGYDIRCEVVGEMGTLSLTNSASALNLRAAGAVTERLPADWRERFARAYDIELQEWVNSVRVGEASGPSSWDGYAAAAIGEAALTALKSGERTEVVTKERPLFYG